MLVRVYRNIPKNCLTVAHRGADGVWTPKHYADHVLLADVEMVVMESGRFRYLNSGQLNLHAWLEGRLVAADSFAGGSDPEAPVSPAVEETFWWGPKAEAVAEVARDCTAVGYNPDVARFFYEKETMDPVDAAPLTLAQAPSACWTLTPEDLPATVPLDALLKEAA